MIRSEYAVVQHADFSAHDRVIAVSDIHGDCAGFDAMLEYIGFGQRDALVIVGDILEKGRESLKLLKRVAALAQSGQVYSVLGNNDTLLDEWLSGAIEDELMLQYMRTRENSVVKDMADELGMPWGTVEEVKRLKAEIRFRYETELAYLAALPHILDSNLATFVHAGIEPGGLYAQNPSYCLTAQAFSRQGYRFEKPVIVGHWPASCYSTKVITAGVHVNCEGNIYSIDGGNSMKRWGQINILTLSPDGGITCDAYDGCRRIRVLDGQKSEALPLSLTFPDTRVNVLETQDGKTKCFVPHLQREMTFDAERIYAYKGNTYCWDFTTYRLPVEAGEIVSYCGEYEDGILIKRQGVIGRYCGRHESV